MASFFGSGSGKSRSNQASGQAVIPYLQGEVQPGYGPLQNELFRQITEALRTGGVGAQLPIIQQSVSGANQALSDTLRQTEGSLASSGLSRTPYGQRILAQTRQEGSQAIGRIPTDIASQFIGQAPGAVQGLLPAILGALASVSAGKSKSGAYAT